MKSGPEHNYNNPHNYIIPQTRNFVGTRISIRFQLTLIGFQTYISGIIIPGVSRDGDRSIEGGAGGWGGIYQYEVNINENSQSKGG